MMTNVIQNEQIRRKGFIALSVALSLLVLGFGVARADEVTIGGSAAGTFVSTGTNTLLGLTYSSSTFNITTESGGAAIGAAPGSPNEHNLGSFTLSGDPNGYSGQQFSLQVTFEVPAGITPGNNPVTFTAALIGTVSTVGGGVFINFSNVPQNFIFSNESATGTFNFRVNDVSVSPNGTVALSGAILGASQTPVGVPEPSALLLLGTGLLGVAGVRSATRKRSS